MFGVDQIELLLFFRQISLAVAGASAFWGVIFLFIKKEFLETETIMWQAAGQKLLWIFLPAIILYAISWVSLAVSLCAFCADAHEGISLAHNRAELTDSMTAQYYFFIALMLIAGASVIKFFVARKLFFANLKWFYGISFIMISIILIYPWSGTESLWQSVSSSLHNWHSILTLGSVIIVDFLYHTLRGNLTPLLSKIFPIITKAIWLGLGLDFLSSGLVFSEAFILTDKLLFVQTVIGIIIINGVFLSGPLARAIINLKKINGLVSLSGAISLASWVSITALDGFRSITPSYIELAVFYLGFIGVLFIANKVLDKTLLQSRP